MSNVEIAEAQKIDAEILDMEKNGYRDHIIKNVTFEYNDVNNSILCSYFRNVNYPVIPKTLRRSLFLQYTD